MGGILLSRVWYAFLAHAVIGEGVRLGTNARLVNRNDRESTRIGDECVIRGILRTESAGVLNFGNQVYVGDQVIISAAQRVVIGESTLIAHGAQIFDNDSHPTNAAQRAAHFRKMLGHGSDMAIEINAAPVEIGARCWIGMNAMIMKGVTIGHEAIVAAGSVVTHDIAPGSVAVGNPARTHTLTATGSSSNS